jgi:hypothetical protein
MMRAPSRYGPQREGSPARNARYFFLLKYRVSGGA